MAFDFRHLRLAFGGGLIFTYRIAGAGLTYVTQVLLARWIGATGLGIFVEAFVWALIISLVIMLGLGAAARRFVTRYLALKDYSALHGYLRRSRQVVLANGFLFAAGSISLVLALNLMPQGPPRTTMLLAFACVPLLAWLRLQNTTGLALSWFALGYVPSVVLRPALFLGLLVAAWKMEWLGTEADAMLLQLVALVAAAIVATALMAVRIRRELLPASPQYHTGDWVRTGIPLIFIAIFFQFYPELNIVIHGLFVPPSELAVFNVAFRTSMLIGFGLIAIDSFVMPAIIKSHATTAIDQMQATLRHAGQVKFGTAVVFLLGLANYGDELLLIFGEEFEAGYWPLMVLAFGQLLRAVIGPVGELAGLTGHHQKCLIVYCAGLIGVLVGHTLVATKWGVLGGAFVAVAVLVVTDLWLRQIIVSRVGVNPSLFGRLLSA